MDRDCASPLQWMVFYAMCAAHILMQIMALTTDDFRLLEKFNKLKQFVAPPERFFSFSILSSIWIVFVVL